MFDLPVIPYLVSLGITWAYLIGVTAELFPAVRAARLPVAAAFRAV